MSSIDNRMRITRWRQPALVTAMVLGFITRGLGQQAAVPVHFWPQEAVVVMPASGVLATVPTIGTPTPFVLDEFLPGALVDPQQEPSFRHDEALDVLTFAVESTRDSRRRLADEYLVVRQEAERMRSLLGRSLQVSATPADDPLLVNERSTSDETRLNALRARVLAHLWRDDLMAMLPQDMNGRFPSQPLERRVAAILDERAVRLVAALSGVTAAAARGGAASLLADEIRRRNGRPNGTALNLSAPFQRLRLNDPVLYGGHSTRLPIPDVQKAIDAFCMQSTGYWAWAEKTNLYSNDDFAVLRRWRMPGVPNPGPLIGRPTPSEEITFQCRQAAERELKLTQAREILGSIAHKLALNFFLGTAVPQTGLEMATEAVSRLELPPDEAARLAKGHELDKDRVMVQLVRYVTLVLGSANISQLGLDAKSMAENVAPFIAALITDRLVVTQFDFRLPGFQGGVEVMPAVLLPGEIPTIDETEPFPELDKLARLDLDLLRPGQLLGDALQNPGTVPRHRAALEQWRTSSDGMITGIEKSPAGKLLRANQQIFSYYDGRLGLLGYATQVAARARDLTRTMHALNEPLGRSSTALETQGRVRLPADSEVIAIHTRAGEFAEAQRPLVSVRHRYRRNGRAFLDSTTVDRLKVTRQSVYEVALTGAPTLPDGVTMLTVVHDLAPRESNNWAMDLELFPAIATSRLSSVTTGLPRYLPVQDSLCAPEVGLLDRAVCAAAAAASRTDALGSLVFLRRIDQ
jgi:hypothetical protein